MRIEEQKQLAATIRKDPVLGKEWIARYQGGDQLAGEILLRVHHGFVRNIAMRYSRPWHRDWFDCLQEGNLGLLEGCRRCDMTHDGSYLNYLQMWIRMRILRMLINQGQGVRIPVHCYQPSYSRRTGERKESVWKPRTRLFSEMPDETTQADQLAWEETIIDDAPLATDALTEARLTKAMKRVAEWFLKQLTEIESDVLRRRNAEPREILSDIGARYGFTRENARLTEERALGKCRAKAMYFAHGVADFRDDFAQWVFAIDAALTRMKNVKVIVLPVAIDESPKKEVPLKKVVLPPDKTHRQTPWSKSHCRSCTAPLIDVRVECQLCRDKKKKPNRALGA